MQDNVASLVNVEADNSEVWLNGATLEMDGGLGRGLTQASQATSVHVQGKYPSTVQNHVREHLLLHSICHSKRILWLRSRCIRVQGLCARVHGL